MRRSVLMLLLLGLAGCTLFDAPDQRFVVFFQEWSAALDPTAQDAVAKAADWANGHPNLTVHVIGYADPQGSPQANRELSRTRAQVVADKLASDGVAPQRIRIDPRGATGYTMDAQEARRVMISLGAR